MPIIVGILTFMSMINFMLSLVQHFKSFKSLDQVILTCFTCIFFKYFVLFGFIFAIRMTNGQHLVELFNLEAKRYFEARYM